MRYGKQCGVFLVALVAGAIGAGMGCAPGGKEGTPFRVVLLPDARSGRVAGPEG